MNHELHFIKMDEGKNMDRKRMLATFLILVFSGFFYINVNASETLEAGDWINYEVIITPILEGEITPISLKLEFVSIEGTNITMQTTLILSDGEKWKDTTNINIASDSSSGLIIPPNSDIGDSININGYGNVFIESITQLKYVGINRTTVYATYKNFTDSLANFWDKETGIILEQNITKNELTTFLKIMDTNIWSTRIDDNNIYLIVFCLVVIFGILITLSFLKIRKRRPQRHIHKRFGHTRYLLIFRR